MSETPMLPLTNSDLSEFPENLRNQPKSINVAYGMYVAEDNFVSPQRERMSLILRKFESPGKGNAKSVTWVWVGKWVCVGAPS